LFDKYLDLDPDPEAKDALGKLKGLGGYKLAILSNGSTAMLSALVRNSGLNAYLDATISVDGARKFKPSLDDRKLQRPEVSDGDQNAAVSDEPQRLLLWSTI
jgi:phosphoglycolate phosphatase-like HAD superfamily hydrolase